MSSQKACRDLEPLLSAYVDHEATAEEMAIVERHTRACVACAARLNQYTTAGAAARGDFRAGLFEAELAGRTSEAARVSSSAESMTPGVHLSARSVARRRLCSSWRWPSLPRPSWRELRPPFSRSPSRTGAQPAAPATRPQPAEPRRATRAGAGCLDRGPGRSGRRRLRAPRRVGRRTAPRRCARHRARRLRRPGRPDAARWPNDLAQSSVPTLAYVAPGQTNAADSALAQSSSVSAAATTPNLDAFLLAVDGHEARTPADPVTLATASAPIQMFEMEPQEALEHRLMDPTIAYLLFVLGLYAVFAEFAHPGSLLPGAPASCAWRWHQSPSRMLPTNWLGVAVLVAAVGLHGARAQGRDARRAGPGRRRLPDRRVRPAVLPAPGSALPLQAEVNSPSRRAVLIGAAVIGLHRWPCCWRGSRDDPRPAADPQPGAVDRRPRHEPQRAGPGRRRPCRRPALVGAAARGAPRTRISQCASSLDTAWCWKWSRRRSAPRLGKERCHDPVDRQSRRADRRPRGSGWHPEPVDPHRARVPAHRRVSPGQVHRRARAGPDLADSVRRSTGLRRPARAVRRDPAPELHHQGQRADPDRFPGLPPGHRRGEQRRRGDQFRQRLAGHRRDDPARGHRRHRRSTTCWPHASRSTRTCASSWTRSPNAGASKSTAVEIREVVPPRTSRTR